MDIRRNMTITEQLFTLRDESYAAFQEKLTPGLESETFIGVRVPELRKFAKKLIRENAHLDFLDTLPHIYYDENMLHGLLLSEIKDYDECIRLTERFLPYIDNWAVCDIFSPIVFKKHRPELIGKIREWTASEEPFICRFGIEMLMSHFLDEDFSPELLEIPASVNSDAYYVKMMVAWFYATALAKQWEYTIPYLENNSLETWTHNKTIQKACESYRITDTQKETLRKMKRRSGKS